MIHLLLLVALFGFIVWLILQVPMPGIVRTLILGFVCFFAVLWFLQVLGVATGFPRVHL